MTKAKGKRRGRKRAKGVGWGRVIWRLAQVALVLGVAGTVSAAAMVVYFGRDLPKLLTLKDYAPKQVTSLFSADGQVLAEFFDERRALIPLEDVPLRVRRAVLAAEDSDFYHHGGLDYLGMVRALFVNLRAGRFAQGGSTITQQVVKTFMLTPERTLARKVKELVLARRIESNLSKDDILYLYLNQIYFGDGCYGIQEAARFYFDKGVRELTLAEASILAALPKGPSNYSPLRHPEAARERQRYVLGEMLDKGWATPDEVRAAEAEELAVVGRRNPYLAEAPYFAEQVRRDLQERFGREMLYQGGLRVETTLRLGLQNEAQRALTEGLRALDRRQGYHKPIKVLSREAMDREVARTAKEVGDHLRSGQVVQGVVTSVDGAQGTMEVAVGRIRGAIAFDHLKRYHDSPEALAKAFPKGSLVRVTLLEDRGKRGVILAPAFGPQGALIALDPLTRHVVAMVGGYDFRESSFNRAIQARRQPGSSFKPLIYAAALATKRYSPATIVVDSPEVYRGVLAGSAWRPQNFERNRYRGAIRLREALAHSVNLVSIKLLRDVGVRAVQDLARRTGISSPLASNLSLALGSSAVAPMEMASAYATFASGGLAMEPMFIRRVLDPQRRVIFERKGEPSRAMRREEAFLISSMLESVIKEGTGQAAKGLGRPAAGKTGTSDDCMDAWFIGYTPDLVAAIWLGFDDMTSLGPRETGGRAAAPIWADFMKSALKDRPKRSFRPPPGVVAERVDPSTGRVVSPGAEPSLVEYFAQGTQRAAEP